MRFFSILIIIYSWVCYVNAQNIQEYGIALKVDEKCMQQIVDLQKVIKNNMPDIIQPANTPHITLYQAAFFTNDLDSIKKHINSISLTQLPIEFQFPDERLLALNVIKTSDLENMHRQIVKFFSPYHRQAIERMKASFENFSSEKQQQIIKYGTTNILEFYNPRLTLWYGYKQADERIDKVHTEIWSKIIDNISYNPNERQYLSCYATNILIGVLGPQGNMGKIIESFNLK